MKSVKSIGCIITSVNGKLLHLPEANYGYISLGLVNSPINGRILFLYRQSSRTIV